MQFSISFMCSSDPGIGGPGVTFGDAVAMELLGVDLILDRIALRKASKTGLQKDQLVSIIV